MILNALNRARARVCVSMWIIIKYSIKGEEKRYSIYFI